MNADELLSRGGDMCYFMTIGVPEKKIDTAREVFGRGFMLHPTANDSISNAFPRHYAMRLLTTGMGMCSCYFYMPEVYVSGRKQSDDHLRRKYAKRGWSEAKIQRAISQSRNHRPAGWRGLDTNIAERLCQLCELAGGVAFVLHWYDHDVEAERLMLQIKQPRQCSELPALASEIHEDEVWQFTPTV